MNAFTRCAGSLLLILSFGYLGQVDGATNGPCSQSSSTRVGWSKAGLTDAAATYETALRDAIASGDMISEAECTREIARIESVLGRHESAYRRLSASLARLKRLENQAERAMTAGVLASVLIKRGRVDEARKYVALASDEASRSNDNGVLASTLFYQGEVNDVERNLAGAQNNFEAAIAAWFEPQFAGRQAEAKVHLANLLMATGSPMRGIFLAKEARATFESLSDDRGIALALIAEANLLSVIGSKQSALELYLRAREIFPNDIERLERARLLNGIGYVYEELGELRLSHSYRLDAISIFKEEGYLPGRMATLPSLIKLSFALGRTDEAFEYHSEISSLARSSADDFWLAIADAQIADHFALTGDRVKAMSMYKKATRVLKRRGLLVELAILTDKIGTLALHAGEFDLAENQFDAALELSRKIHHKISEANVLANMALLAEQHRDLEQAVSNAKNSISLIDQIYSQTKGSLLRRNFLSSAYEKYELHLRLLMTTSRGSNSEDQWRASLAAAENTRARSLQQGIEDNLNKPPLDADPESIARLSDLVFRINERSDRLTTASSREDASASDSLERELEGLRHELEQLRADMRLQSPIYSALSDPSPFDLASFQDSTISDNELLIEYHLGEKASYLWIVGKRELYAYDLPAKSLIDSRTDDLRRLLGLSRPGSQTVPEWSSEIGGSQAEYSRAAREFSNMILGPVAEKIKGKRLIVVPDGKLNYFPISALPMPGSESDDPILLTNEVIYQPSAQTYALLKKIGQERKDERPKDLLVFSDPVFNPADERLTGIDVAQSSTEPYRFRLVESFSSLSRLPASKAEAETVSNAVGGADMFTGFDATRERLLSTNLADYKVVHLATHGFLDPERPELSSLILSRYDSSGKAIDESIRMHDIYSMKLNAELVVLSACQTGTGKEIKGEGVMGLNTAFLQSGARSVVSTLWQVEDNAANELMKEFYGKMVDEGMSPSAALRAAQIKLYNDPQFRSPFFWAAFTVHGDAATSTPFKRDHTRLAIGLSGLALLSLAALFFFRWRYRTSKV